MRRWVIFISVILLAAWVASPVTSSAPAEKALRALSGEISAIDASAQTMTVKEEISGSGIEEVNFIIDPNASIRIHGLKGKNLGQLKAGDYVTVRYYEKDGKNVALEIQHS